MDDHFKQYQELRAQQENRLREMFFEWLMGDAPDGMKISDARALSEMLIHFNNQASREAYDLGCTAY